MFAPEEIPEDILPFIFTHLTNRKDLFATALASRVFNRAALPILYRKLDARAKETKKGIVVNHPAETLLKRHELARYVFEVQESDRVLPQSLRALALCTQLRAFTWVDESELPDGVLLAFLDVLENLPLRILTIRTFGDLGKPVWDKLRTFTALEKVSIWCMQGPPRILQGWSECLSNTLTSLELGRCSGVPATILISVLSHLQRLEHLRLKGAPSNTLPFIVSSLPNLKSVDTDYNDATVSRPSQKLPPPLRILTVRTSSLDVTGPRNLWRWINELTPRRSLESFTLHSFSTMGETSVPRRFILDLAAIHGPLLKQFRVGSTELTLSDIECLCDLFPNLEELSCSVACADARSIQDVTAHAQNLRTLRLKVQWLHFDQIRKVVRDDSLHFTIENARRMMLRENSVLRVISTGPVVYKGQWVRAPSGGSDAIQFEVSRIYMTDARDDT
ncbi:hypothetical protein BD410DRAFT_822477 [Rickenella mellea]|uniref:F-box domain-containing protein n=1 Tax=Rickenella mellea TaxID=50990 RepID=A0A4Y7PRF2_9AGAM|nr:hypothetical protein BD410DRAFT_822477 [Rickenella mellea]